MRIWNKIYRLWLSLVRRIMFPWVRFRVISAPQNDVNELTGPVCYVMERSGVADAAVLEQECIQAGRRAPSEGIQVPGIGESNAMIYVRRFGRRLLSRNRPPDLSRLERIVQSVRDGQPEDVTLVPVSIFWGRTPDKERSAVRLMVAEDWAIAGRLKRLFRIGLNGRNVLVQMGIPMSIRAAVEEGQENERTVRKLARVLRVHFRRQRIATIGPDLSHRRMLIGEVLHSQRVQKDIEHAVETRGAQRQRVSDRARKYAREIAADYSAPFVRIAERTLARLWGQIYDGIEIGHLDNLKQVAEGSEIVYVPCHRSHIDYLLLSYVVYGNGLVVPHIAAGINLNLPFLGRILRKGGAFYLRRSFKDNALYAAVFDQYLSLNLAKGVSIEYFIEGGRSRTGRLLSGKAGMLAMTVRSFLRDTGRPLVFVPVYFGYERLIEGDSYVSELSGRPKKKETLVGLLKSLRTLRSRFGKVYVNFGEPINLTDMLDKQNPTWREDSRSESERPEWEQAFIQSLADRILIGVNRAAAVNAVNILATVMLSTPRNSMIESDVIRMLHLNLNLLRKAPYSKQMTLVDLTARQIVDYCEKFGFLRRKTHKLGDILYFEESDAILMSYFRNNIAHLFAMPSMLACCFLDRTAVTEEEILALVDRIYPYIRSELHIRWEPQELPDIVRGMIAVFLEEGLLVRGDDDAALNRPSASTSEAMQLSMMARLVLPALERYYITISLLLKHGSGTLTQDRLEELTQLMAQRLAMLYQLNAPEFFDRNLFRAFIARMREHDAIRIDEHGLITFKETLRAADEAARLTLGERFRHDVLQSVHL
jgi:glycerol-3-phosphate O-acyltransferase